MGVPKTPVHEDDLSPARENDIWRTWEIASMKPEAVADTVEEATYDQFRRGILALNAGHQSASAFHSPVISQCTTPSSLFP